MKSMSSLGSSRGGSDPKMESVSEVDSESRPFWGVVIFDEDGDADVTG